ncbi:MAG: AMP-binding protein [Acidimicrobiales bacterium]
MTAANVLHEIIERAHTGPYLPAAKDLERELNYAQLIEEVARLGAGLSARGVVEGDRVALLLPNSVDFIVAALASLWIGATFVPLANSDPKDRLETILVDCAPALVVTSDEADTDFPVGTLGGVSSVAISLLRSIEAVPVIPIDAVSRVAYIIYTSGTTGTPKGVQIGDTAFAAAVQSTANAVGLNRATRTLCVSPFHFDGSYANLFTTLVSGGAVIIRPRDALLFPRTFFNAVLMERITYTGFTPSYLRLLLASPEITKLRGSTLEIIALGGEVSSIVDLRTLWSEVPEIRVFNRYGPTETAIAVTNVELGKDIIEDGVVTMGCPHPGVSFVLVDNDGRIIDAEGRIGELYIGGVQLMNGYWADADLTKEVMRSDVVPGEVLYRSGDLVYRDELGNYIYVDRADRVVKRSGVRISLVELNASLNKLDHVTAAACLTFDRDGELGIVAFVATDAQFSALDLRRAAGTVIPETMLPDRIELITALPLNKSNKLDESRLLSGAGIRAYRPNSARSSIRP